MSTTSNTENINIKKCTILKQMDYCINNEEIRTAESGFHCIAIMQPYFFPYIGYYQLIAASDIFVIYDDGKMIKNGYIHKNYILSTSSKPSSFAIGLRLHSKKTDRSIRETELIVDRSYIVTIIRNIENRYKRAPYYKNVMPLLKELLLQQETNLARYLGNSIKAVCDYIGINTRIEYSSAIDKSGLKFCEEKAFRICRSFGMENYINPIGGQSLYDKNLWKQNGINLYFLKRNNDIWYKQFKEPFLQDLSVIDVMMFNSPEEIKGLLERYTLL